MRRTVGVPFDALAPDAERPLAAGIYAEFLRQVAYSTELYDHHPTAATWIVDLARAMDLTPGEEAALVEPLREIARVDFGCALDATAFAYARARHFGVRFHDPRDSLLAMAALENRGRARSRVAGVP